MTAPSDQKAILAKLEKIQYLLEELIVLKAIEMDLSTHGIRRILRIRRGRVSEISRLRRKSLKS